MLGKTSSPIYKFSSCAEHVLRNMSKMKYVTSTSDNVRIELTVEVMWEYWETKNPELQVGAPGSTAAWEVEAGGVQVHAAWAV